MSDKQIIYTMSKVGKVHGVKQVLKDISLSYYYGAKIGVLGLNGSGKSTLLRILAGIDDNHLGETSLAKGYVVGYLEQEPKLDESKTVRDIVREGVQPIVDMLNKFDEINNQFAEPMSDEEMNKLLEKQAKLQDQLDAANAWELDSRLDLAMEALRCPPSEQLIGTLSGGERRRVALCRLLLQSPDILLLDEPTNHLDAETILWLEKHLQEYKGTIIAVTHDRYFLDNVAGWILELDRGQGIPFKGNYSSWLDQKAKRLAIEEKQESKKQKALKEELEWIRSSPKARQAKSKARIAEYERRMNEEKDKRNETTQIYIPPGPRLGKLVIEANGISKAYGDKLLYENLTFKLPPGGIVGVIGPNGAGKTTLFRMMTGGERPDGGTFKVGDTVKLSYVNQDRSMDGNKTVHDVIADGGDIIKLGHQEVNARAYIAKFNFSGDDHKKRVSELSGGERNRVHLARMLREEGNVLLLDEPTNDLDVHTLRALEEALIDYPGCAVVISHDRYFLDRIATHILAFEGESQVVWFDGNFSDYEEDKKRRLGENALIPKRVTYKKLKRV
ncbi:MAG: energy-dependent translational throttle protein EttA [Bdellovibrionales bacterium RIFOXYD12_FULL_39_22]|nr:MAG: energy-dependent translational throttle protein EttA [Bdellovibrionales bacterium RIFOXYB1_FULL_39_21]OFZ40600.1 MAG: energy-dependent translational throttle protein EttA [Bdellovibrionales bacterium RIFOXYC12_FULL_39_17]OFZ50452.1 MAG: energy-dependent translational throttle protein EttA [Bdellovibrionales bacterium RIFOXYC1_FULL_39_130]OFZ72009.1 MAG: energy-dependent translational throttle protein EttA [Bdellovibrionales bacterium RIFOXYC2_FULL_39_8]OFZ77711.1 MAG: energy-dependent t